MSRTTAIATTRGAAHAKPWTNRAASSASKLVGHHAEERGEREDREAYEQHRLAPQPVAERPVEELPDGEADHVARQHQLLAVGVVDAEFCAHLRQRGQHDVNGERRQSHQRRDHRDELSETRHGQRRRGGSGLGHGLMVSRGQGRISAQYYSAEVACDQTERESREEDNCAGRHDRAACASGRDGLAEGLGSDAEGVEPGGVVVDLAGQDQLVGGVAPR